ncbi:phage head closure protein [Glaesserella parasuis]|uniref:phage head closure protein n=1 Tax=Glaesserella parasuis TaxID=738 RepID=UPI0003AC0906|nr:phage head closure protein [Glaesserella parasuis]ATW46088.1 phage head-tail adapter protein [Glaesserella parasuis str. Nagasaki]EQA01411.1 phage head-tail joining family protein [Glaesserella parasuis str. Nagasaki]EYE72139.1 phage head-tail adaptor [Glaesserella parasuis str. Nagasaki]MDP0068853.1 phage head closure protein [Glaesserella parasuis]MDP0244689.1 phage head closure protein [Glaesserella parasuis]
MARMVKAGTYDKVITLQQIAKPKPNEQGKIIRNGSVLKNEWEDIKTLRASIEPIQGREYFSGVFQMGDTVVRIRMRYQPDLEITRKMRVKYGNRIFKIENVIDSKEQHRELQLMCKEGEAHNG